MKYIIQTIAMVAISSTVSANQYWVNIATTSGADSDMMSYPVMNEADCMIVQQQYISMDSVAYVSCDVEPFKQAVNTNRAI